MKISSFYKEKGAEPVEFIFVMMMMMLLFIFFVDFGRAFAIKAVLAEASRAAARAISVCETDDAARALAQNILDGAPRGVDDAPYVCDITACQITPLEKEWCDRDKGDEMSVSVTFSHGFLTLLALPNWFDPLTVSVTTVINMQEKCGTPEVCPP